MHLIADRNQRTSTLFWIALIAVGVVVVTLSDFRAPRARGQKSPVDVFSAERAAVHLSRIAVAPHPVGSAYNARVREYIVAQLRGMGLEVDVQSGVAFLRRSLQIYNAGNVHNIVARLPGTKPAKSVLLVCHYDSVTSGPGASDDGIYGSQFPFRDQST
jgi:acetylornithine deacetylase/succinyl-diaminopimelate desuccinylase-like protein